MPDSLAAHVVTAILLLCTCFQVLGLGVEVHVALAACACASAVVALLAVVRALSLILTLVPNSIKLAVVVGMGLLLSFIGLQVRPWWAASTPIY